MRQHAFSLTIARTKAEFEVGPHTALTLKYLGTELDKERFELAIALMGSRALGWEGASFTEQELLTTQEWLLSKALSISEVENITDIQDRLNVQPDQAY